MDASEFIQGWIGGALKKEGGVNKCHFVQVVVQNSI